MNVRVEAAEVSNYSEGIVLVRFLPNVGLELSHAEEIIAAVLRVAEDKLHGNLVDARELLFMTNEARARFGRQSPPTLSATAILVGSSVQRTLGNIYLSVARPTNPTKLFSETRDAVSYLREQNERARHLRHRPLSSAPPARGRI